VTAATVPQMPRFTGRLEPEHIALTDQLIEHWMGVGLSTERVDRAAAEQAVTAAYRAAGAEPAPITIWMDSPLGGTLATAVIRQLRDPLRGQLRGRLWDQLGNQLGDQLRHQLGGQLWDQLGGQLWDQLGGQLWDQLREQLRGQLWGQLGNQLWGQLGDQLGNQLGDQLRHQLGDQLGDQLWGQLRDQLGGQLWDQLGGQWATAVSPWRDAYWAALHVAARAAAALAPSPRLDSMAAAIGAVDHWWPMRGAVVLTDRPTVIARDGQGRLHSETGPALAYSDGWAIHAVHGVRVPAEVIEHPEAITVDRILTAPNTEVRRVMIELRGWDWFTAAAGLCLVDTADDPGNPGETIALWDLPEQVYDEPVRVVLVTNASPERDGTRRRYGLTVPADCDSAESAVAWTFGVDADDYRSLARAT